MWPSNNRYRYRTRKITKSIKKNIIYLENTHKNIIIRLKKINMYLNQNNFMYYVVCVATLNFDNMNSDDFNN